MGMRNSIGKMLADHIIPTGPKNLNAKVRIQSGIEFAGNALKGKLTEADVSAVFSRHYENVASVTRLFGIRHEMKAGGIKDLGVGLPDLAGKRLTMIDLGYDGVPRRVERVTADAVLKELASTEVRGTEFSLSYLVNHGKAGVREETAGTLQAFRAKWGHKVFVADELGGKGDFLSDLTQNMIRAGAKPTPTPRKAPQLGKRAKLVSDLVTGGKVVRYGEAPFQYKQVIDVATGYSRIPDGGRKSVGELGRAFDFSATGVTADGKKVYLSGTFNGATKDKNYANKINLHTEVAEPSHFHPTPNPKKD